MTTPCQGSQSQVHAYSNQALYCYKKDSSNTHLKMSIFYTVNRRKFLYIHKMSALDLKISITVSQIKFLDLSHKKNSDKMLKRDLEEETCLVMLKSLNHFIEKFY